MTKRLKMKILVNAALGIVLLGVCAAVLFYYMHSRDTVAIMQEALKAAELNEHDKAIRLFGQVLAKDADNETAVVKLAEIYDRIGNWPYAGFYWLRAAKLNNLNENYPKKFLSSVMKGRFFARISTYLKNQRAPLSLDEQLLLDYCLLMDRHPEDGVALWKKILQESPEAGERPYGRLIRATNFAGDKTFDWLFKELDELSKSDNDFISQEAIIALSRANRMAGRFEEEEKNLKTIAERNFYIGTPLLGEFHSNHLRFAEAMEAFESYLGKYSSSSIAMVLGELYVFTSQHEKLGKLVAGWKGKSGKNNIKTAYYLEALDALAKHDLAAMTTFLKPIHGLVGTPLGTFMDLFADAQANDTMALESDLHRFAKLPPFFDMRQRTYALAVLYLQDRMKAGVPATELLRLAETLLNANLDSEDSLPRLISLIGRLQNNSLTAKELADAMAMLPNDTTCLEIAVAFHYARGNFQEALEYIGQIEAKDGGGLSWGMKRLAVSILVKAGRIDEATARLMRILEEDKSPNTFTWAFFLFFENDSKDNLRKLIELAGDSKELAPAKLCCEAGIKLLEGDLPAGLGMLENLDAADDILLYFAGMQLASNGRPAKAIEKLTGVKPAFPSYPQVLCHLSALHLESGDNEMARRCAEKAIDLVPSLPEARKRMALCARASDDWRLALEHSSPVTWKQNNDGEHKALWIWGMEKNIAFEFEAGHHLMAKELCTHLRLYDKDNKTAAEYATQIDKLLNDAKNTEAK